MEGNESTAVTKLRQALESAGKPTNIGSLSIKVKWGQGDLKELGNIRTFMVKYPETFKIDDKMVSVAGPPKPSPQPPAAAAPAVAATPLTSKRTPPAGNGGAEPAAEPAEVKRRRVGSEAPEALATSKAAPSQQEKDEAAAPLATSKSAAPAPVAVPKDGGSNGASATPAPAAEGKPGDGAPGVHFAIGAALPKGGASRIVTGTPAPKKPSAADAAKAPPAAGPPKSPPLLGVPKAAPAAPGPLPAGPVVLPPGIGRMAPQPASPVAGKAQALPWRVNRAAAGAANAAKAPPPNGAEAAAGTTVAAATAPGAGVVAAPAAAPPAAAGAAMAEPQVGAGGAPFGKAPASQPAGPQDAPAPWKSMVGKAPSPQEAMAQPPMATGGGAVPSSWREDTLSDDELKREIAARKGAGVDLELRQLAARIAPSKEYTTRAMRCLSLVRGPVATTPSAKRVVDSRTHVDFYGSHAQGTEIDGADVDIVLRLPPDMAKEDRDAIVQALSSTMQGPLHAKSIEVNEGTRVYPHAAASLSLQLIDSVRCVGHVVLSDQAPQGVQAPWTLDGAVKQLCDRCEVARDIIRLVKLWAANQGLANHQEGYMSSIAWTLLVIFFLQNDARLLPPFATVSQGGSRPVPVRPTATLTDLLSGFFAFLASRASGTPLCFSVFDAQERSSPSNVLFVEDPAERCRGNMRSVTEAVQQAQWLRTLEEAKKVSEKLSQRAQRWFHWAEVFDPREARQLLHIPPLKDMVAGLPGRGAARAPEEAPRQLAAAVPPAGPAAAAPPAFTTPMCAAAAAAALPKSGGPCAAPPAGALPGGGGRGAGGGKGHGGKGHGGKGGYGGRF